MINMDDNNVKDDWIYKMESKIRNLMLKFFFLWLKINEFLRKEIILCNIIKKLIQISEINNSGIGGGWYRK